MTEVLIEVVVDTLKVLPFLFFTYLAMEYIETRMGEKAARALADTNRMGPLLGAVCGLIPQCGFSATAAGLYAGGLVSAGTILSVFLSTSDEMLPVLLAHSAPAGQIIKILSWKVVIAVIMGLFIDRFMKDRRHVHERVRIHELCEHEHCSCGSEHGGILKPALRHTGKTIWFIFLITLLAAVLLHVVGEEAVAGFLSGQRFVGVFLAALVGLIPNCAASVMLTTLFLEGIVTTGQLMAGLLCSAGVGLLVLFRTNHHRKENVRILGILYASGVVWGLLFEVLSLHL